MALYVMLMWRWLPYTGCWCGGGCLTWGAGVAVASLIWHDIVLLWASMALYGMLVWLWLPHMGCWCGGGCPYMT